MILDPNEKQPYSCLMAVYGGDDALDFRAAVESMLGQTVRPDEIVIVCDGPLTPSLDGVLNSLCCTYDNIVPIRLSSNVGLGLALARGLNECRHELVARMDSDDISVPNRCELQLAKIASSSACVVGGFIEEFETTPGDLGSVRAVPLSTGQIKKYAKFRNPMNHVTVMMRKSAVLEVGGYEAFPLMEDYYLWTRLLLAGYQLVNLDQVLVHVRIGKGMYSRRGGLAYLNTQARFIAYLKRSGMISIPEAALSLAIRGAVTCAPSVVRKWAYEKRLRSQSNERLHVERGGDSA